MSNLFSRKTIMLVWLVVVLGLFAALEAPMSLAAGILPLVVWGMVPALVFLLWQKPSPRMAEVLHQAETPSERIRWSIRAGDAATQRYRAEESQRHPKD
jgi:hypothetical protein